MEKKKKRFIYIKAVPRLVRSDSVVGGSVVLYGGRYESRVACIYLPTRTGNTRSVTYIIIIYTSGVIIINANSITNRPSHIMCRVDHNLWKIY